MERYKFSRFDVDSIELKCLLISRGLKIDRDIYRKLGETHRIFPNALTCNCLKLPDDTIVMATDLGFHLDTLSAMFSWDNLKLFKYMSDMKTDFRISLIDETPTLLYEGERVCPVQFLPATAFYKQKTSSGMPFVGNSVLQGCDWVAFQCLWPCEYACMGKACQYCFSGGQYEALAKRGKSMPFIPSPQDVAEVIQYAIQNDGVNSIQITGGSTFEADVEEAYIVSYMEKVNELVGRENIAGEILLYITPPARLEILDRYFSLGADRIACSIEVWDDERATVITPGKRKYTTKSRHLNALSYIAERYGPGKAFSNFIIGLEPLETLREGASWMAERGIIPSASVWMPFGKPVMGSVKAPDLDFFRAVKEMLAELYMKHKLYPAGNCGLNVCIEKDIWRWAVETAKETPF